MDDLGKRRLNIAIVLEGEFMKIKTLFVLVVIAFGWRTGAQTGFGLPSLPASAQTYEAPPSLWVVNGQIYNINKSSLWGKMEGDIVRILTNGIVVETFTIKPIQQAVVVRRLKANSYMTTDESKKYHDVTEMVDVGTEKVPGRKIIIRNYPLEESPAVGKTIAFFAMQTGTTDYNGDRLELWDLGVAATENDLRKLKAGADEQRRIASEKTAAAKKASQAKSLKSLQDLADKGDAFGLLRMGERYRDGDGVEKDLVKAKEYLTKASAAGSPSAADALLKLNRFLTNPPATQ